MEGMIVTASLAAPLTVSPDAALPEECAGSGAQAGAFGALLAAELADAMTTGENALPAPAETTETQAQSADALVLLDPAPQPNALPPLPPEPRIERALAESRALLGETVPEDGAVDGVELAMRQEAHALAGSTANFAKAGDANAVTDHAGGEAVAAFAAAAASAAPEGERPVRIEGFELAATSHAAPSHAAGVHTSELRSTPDTPVATFAVDTPVASREFPEALSQRIVWMAGKDAQMAELKLNPPELGPVEVRLTISGDEASAYFVAQAPETRSAIESAIGRLREAMAEAGLQLGEATVSAESHRERAGADPDTPGGRRDGGSSRHGAGGGEAAWRGPSAPVVVKRGLIDVFA